MGAKYDLNENIHLLGDVAKGNAPATINIPGTRRFYSRSDLSVHHRTDGDKTFTKSWLSDRPTVRRCRGQTHQSGKLKFEMGKFIKSVTWTRFSGACYQTSGNSAFP
jgi:hypothetical protein